LTENNVTNFDSRYLGDRQTYALHNTHDLTGSPLSKSRTAAEARLSLNEAGRPLSHRCEGRKLSKPSGSHRMPKSVVCDCILNQRKWWLACESKS